MAVKLKNKFVADRPRRGIAENAPMTTFSATLLLAVVLGLSSAASPAPDSAVRASIDASRPADLHATVQQEGAKVAVGGAGVGGVFVVEDAEHGPAIHGDADTGTITFQPLVLLASLFHLCCCGGACPLFGFVAAAFYMKRRRRFTGPAAQEVDAAKEDEQYVAFQPSALDEYGREPRG